MFQTFQRTMILTGVMFITSPAVGEPLACSEGKRLSCIEYGAKVVKGNAVCLDPLSCDHEGFVCKADLNSLAEEHEGLIGSHNELISKYNELVSVYEKTVAAYDRYVRCVSVASKLEDADACEPES